MRSHCRVNSTFRYFVIFPSKLSHVTEDATKFLLRAIIVLVGYHSE
jgi:hypothetical protein